MTDPIRPAEVTTSGLDGPTEDHLLQMELTIELPAPPAVVWEAIATGPGLSLWFLETDLEERAGGHVAFHMGPEMASEGEVTAWEPGARLEYAEPDWVALASRENSGQTPLVSEFLIEATSGGTSILRVVSSAYGTGAEWEREWFADMVANWAPSFDTLARYVARHAGLPGVRVAADLHVDGHPDQLWPQVVALFGTPAIGDEVRIGAASGVLERLHDEPNVKELLVRFDAPAPGFGVMGAYEIGGSAVVTLGGSVFGDDAQQHAEALQADWLARVGSLTAG